jgi:hypothetical protein
VQAAVEHRGPDVQHAGEASRVMSAAFDSMWRFKEARSLALNGLSDAGVHWAAVLFHGNRLDSAELLTAERWEDFPIAQRREKEVVSW